MTHTTAPQSPDSDVVLQWWADGELAVAGIVDRLTDDELSGGSVCQGWSRAHVVAHLARNADALVNLLTWARTGVETPMYPSREVRDSGIAATAARPPAELRGDYVVACARLAQAIESMPADAWTAQVRNGQGATVPASVVPWMRAKEIWVHGTDLRAGLSFADLPDDFCAALVDEVLGLFAARGQAPDVTVVATDVDRTWGDGGTRVGGPVAAVAAWLTRSEASGLTGDVPPPPAWL
ncbi:maleylpyruvate isomerase family mycothiol-dependent enzyme [Blastococcus capsensis]|uniref:maleylpyruvate isomerase family mycothiol-dependent enzyme n=1 Tax=Blastococcus capsensis TaxID=1564163 RepID=UPI00253F7771|nr:maleylpyruvate isomerase family mycothiol-dependent enzyme [Blastococcus capsensis]MDK3256557.1 maleylpyruvate isomerase family mycothiol-dependent enzyme [Blastococcus capsensis]